MTTKSEQVLLALFDALGSALPLDGKLLRNAALPERIPASGLMILRDGDPGSPEVLLSPATYIYEHRAEVDVIVEAKSGVDPDAAFDLLKSAIGLAIATDRTLGGLCDYVLGDAPEPIDLAVEGGAVLKAATIAVVLTYATSDPLA